VLVKCVAFVVGTVTSADVAVPLPFFFIQPPVTSKVTEVNCPQDENACAAIEVTLAGIVRLVT
jgi:hypothetical protein